jgi:gliding motility-associated-like protein
LLPISGEGRWTQSNAQQTLGVRILEPLNPQTVIRGLQAGNLYEFTWTIVSGCGGLFDKVAVLTSDTDPNAGDDAIVCNEDQTAVLKAVTPAAMISLGTWSSPNPKISFTDLDDPKATAFNLEIGRNTFIWTIDDALCGNAGRDTVVFTYKQNPLAIRDIVAAAFNAKTEFNVLANDTVPAGTTVRIVTQPGNGSIESLNSGRYSYLPKGNFVGADELTYEICSQGCECSSEKVIFQIGENVACNIPSIITPNGDGINDLFVVPCFIVDTNYPNNQVSIFNQWGDEVYHSSIPYRNNWDGKFNGEDLPPGTYFYIINFGDSTEAKSGFVMIQR